VLIFIQRRYSSCLILVVAETCVVAGCRCVGEWTFLPVVAAPGRAFLVDLVVPNGGAVSCAAVPCAAAAAAGGAASTPTTITTTANVAADADATTAGAATTAAGAATTAAGATTANAADTTVTVCVVYADCVVVVIVISTMRMRLRMRMIHDLRDDYTTNNNE